MLSDEVLEKVTERIVERIQNVNTDILKRIGSSIKEIGRLTPSQAHQLVQVFKYGGDYNKIINELAKVSNLTTKEIKEIFEEIAKNDYLFAKQFYDYRGISYIPYEENTALKSEVEAIANITARRCAEMMTPRALGFGMIDKETGDVTFKGLKQTYYDLLDEAVISVSQGKETFDQAMSKQIKQMGGSGLKVIYESTYINKDGVEVHNSRRLDSAIRMNLKDSLRELHNETQDIFGREFGADGVEISVHGNPAPDHAEVQGKQFSNDEFDKFQNDELAISYDGIEFEPEFDGKDRRAISEYNCYHYTFSIVLGVSKPEYSNEELKKIIDDNNKGFDLDGKHYTLYEGTQLQRRLETEIRKEKDTQIMAKEAGQQDVVQQSQQRITQLTNKYKELCDKSGLPTRMDRMKVSGYRRMKLGKEPPTKPKINASELTLEQQELKKNNIIEVKEKKYDNIYDIAEYVNIRKDELYGLDAKQMQLKINDQYGFNDKPTLLSKREFDNLKDANNYFEPETNPKDQYINVYRGWASKKHYDDYINAESKDFKYGEGGTVDGVGTYTTTNRWGAEQYSLDKETGEIDENRFMELAIPTDTKFISFGDLEELHYKNIYEEYNNNREWFENKYGNKVTDILDIMNDNVSSTAVLNGYEIIYNNDDRNWVILNRSKVIIKENK